VTRTLDLLHGRSPPESVRLLPLHEVREFVDRRSGEVREITDPDGAPTGRQLLALWHMGALAIVFPDAERHVFSRAQAAGAIAWLRGGDE
jgi:hypothetical protein